MKMNKPIINLTQAVALAKAAILWWEETPDFLLCQKLAIHEPTFVVRARTILSTARGRTRISVHPKERKFIEIPDGLQYTLEEYDGIEQPDAILADDTILDHKTKGKI